MTSLDSTCPNCGANGFNQIWECGSMRIGTDVSQSPNCRRIQKLNAEFKRLKGELEDAYARIHTLSGVYEASVMWDEASDYPYCGDDLCASCATCVASSILHSWIKDYQNKEQIRHWN